MIKRRYRIPPTTKGNGRIFASPTDPARRYSIPPLSNAKMAEKAFRKPVVPHVNVRFHDVNRTPSVTGRVL